MKEGKANSHFSFRYHVVNSDIGYCTVAHAGPLVTQCVCVCVAVPLVSSTFMGMLKPIPELCELRVYELGLLD